MTTTNRRLLAGVAAVAILALPMLDASLNEAFAQSSSTNVFTTLQGKAQDLFYNARTIILIICALAIIVTMATAITGRFPIMKAVAIAGAIVVIGLASEIVTYFAGAAQQNQAGSYTLNDTAQGGSP